jgi:hypothetical protein
VSTDFGFPAFIFQHREQRVPVVVEKRLLPFDRTDDSGNVVGKCHWFMHDGSLYVSQDAFAEIRRLADARH